MKQAERVERSTRALLHAAAEIIVESGYEGLSIGAVGERAGYSRGLVTARFGSKKGLVDALIDRASVQCQEQILMPSLEQTSGLDRITGTYRTMADQWDDDPSVMLCLWALLFNAIGTSGHLRRRCFEHHEATRSTVARWLELGQSDESVGADLDPANEATYELGVLRGISYQGFVDPGFDIGNALRGAAGEPSAASAQRFTRDELTAHLSDALRVFPGRERDLRGRQRRRAGRLAPGHRPGRQPRHHDPAQHRLAGPVPAQRSPHHRSLDPSTDQHGLAPLSGSQGRQRPPSASLTLAQQASRSWVVSCRYLRALTGSKPSRSKSHWYPMPRGPASSSSASR